MNEAAGVELDLEVDGSRVHIWSHHSPTLLVLGVALHVHDPVEPWVSNVDVYLHAISQAVDQHLWAREVSSPEWHLFCREDWRKLVQSVMSYDDDL